MSTCQFELVAQSRTLAVAVKHWQSLPPCFGTTQVHAVPTAAWNLAGVSDVLVGLANKLLICVTH
jgi:hypothetical protein